MYPYRIFLSYAHEDGDNRTVETIASYLRKSGCILMWDKAIDPGAIFTEKIKELISFSHLFIPILTKDSITRPWVHQETGFALGLDIPVLPISIGSLPDQMIQTKQALIIEHGQSDISSYLKDHLAERLIEKVILPPGSQPKTSYHTGHVPETRTQLIAEYAEKVGSFGDNCDKKIRQIGALSSFCLPNASTENQIWKQREGQIPTRSSYYHDLQRRERVVLESLYDSCGCDLVINPWFELSKNGPEARRVRLDTLKDFFHAKQCKNIRVACKKKLKPENLLIVGDWFYAQSVTPKPGVGYLQTNFTWHAPSVLYFKRKFESDFEEYLRNFENDFKDCFKKLGPGDGTSCRVCISIIQEIINSISL